MCRVSSYLVLVVSLYVDVKTSPLNEAVVTVFALIGLLARVEALVVNESFLGSEALPAPAAYLRLFPSVSPLVLLQLELVVGLVVTEPAGIFLTLLLVGSPLMVLHLDIVLEHLATVCAHDLLVLRVVLHVDVMPQILPSHESLRANVTNMIPLSPVETAHVLFLVRLVTEISTAVLVVTADGRHGDGASLGNQHSLLLQLCPVHVYHVLLGPLLDLEDQ